jgi:ribonuclease P protein component
MQGQPDQRLPRSRRLTRGRDLDNTFQHGEKRIGRYMVMWIQATDGESRVGVVSSRKVGDAVARNHARRRLRESFRRLRARLPAPARIVLVARPVIGRATADAVDEEFLRLASLPLTPAPEGRG